MEQVTAHLCMTKDIGIDGHLFGGNMMAWLDEAGGIYARRYTGGLNMVTLKFTELVYKYPVHVGEIVDIHAGNPRIGKTSLTFDLVGRVAEKAVIETTCTYVHVDGEGRPTPIPQPVGNIT